MASDTVQRSRDWLRSPRTNLLAWWIPQAAFLAGLFVPVPVRAVIWIIALIWMGTACILNARLCGRTHCRYTGPYYLAMICQGTVGHPAGVPKQGLRASIRSWHLWLKGVSLSVPPFRSA